MLPVKRIVLNLAQQLAAWSKAKTIILEWGRGTGKSTILAWYFMQMCLTMPRGKFYLAGNSFKQMLGETLPSTFESLERMGWYENIHFTVGRPGPAHWPRPFQRPANWHNFIHTYTGAAFSLVSQDKSKVEARGQNFDGGIGDEVALLDPKRLFNECHAGMRTNRESFKRSPFYLTKVYASSTPMTREGQWFLKYEGEAIAEALRIKESGKEPAQRRYNFLRANALVNRANLSPTWFDEMRADAVSQMMFDAEIMNIRPNLVVNSFYPMLKPKLHYYSMSDSDYWLGQLVDRKQFFDTAEGDMDYDKNKPLIINFDPGAAINVVIAKQLHESKGERQQRTLKSWYRKHPSIIQELIEHDVLPYYAGQKYKVVDLFYDRTAKNRVANSRTTIADDVIAIFRRAGWRVNDRTIRRVVTQDEKYHVNNKVLKEDPNDAKLYKARINRDNNRDLIISLENAEAKEVSSRGGRKMIAKNKLSEKRIGTTPRQHATDFSDAWDLSEHYYARVAMRATEGVFRDVIMIG